MRDKSGLRFYYQPAKPEVQDLVTLTLGTNLLEIPPGKIILIVFRTCRHEESTRLFTGSLSRIQGIRLLSLIKKQRGERKKENERKTRKLQNKK